MFLCQKRVAVQDEYKRGRFMNMQASDV